MLQSPRVQWVRDVTGAPRQFSVLHVIASLHPRGGGTSITVADLADTLAQIGGIEVQLVTQGRFGDPMLPTDPRVRTCISHSTSPASLAAGLPIYRALHGADLWRMPVVVHSHGLWTPANQWASLAARKHGVPLIVQPHGMLAAWAMRHKALKKRVAMSLYQARALRSADLIVATADSEYADIRRLGFDRPVAIIPNGVRLETKASMSCERLPGAPRRVLFLSRIHPVKGILNLLNAWARLAPRGWLLELVGPDEGGHLKQVLATIDALGISSSVVYRGEADAASKANAFAEADLFVLPSFTENFGVVIAEALSHGVPVITTRGTPWADLETHRCGWWIDVGVEPLVGAMLQAMSLTDKERSSMGTRGQALVRRFNWPAIALELIEVYGWLLGRNGVPANVRMN